MVLISHFFIFILFTAFASLFIAWLVFCAFFSCCSVHRHGNDIRSSISYCTFTASVHSCRTCSRNTLASRCTSQTNDSRLSEPPHYSRGSQPMARVPLVVREGLPRWYASNFHFFTKKKNSQLSSLRIGLCFWINKFSCSLLFLLYGNIMTFHALLANLHRASTNWWKVNKNKNLIKFSCGLLL